MNRSVNKLPSAFAIQRSLVITDALMFNAELETRKCLSPVLVVEHGLRGTQNVNTEKGGEKNISNVQVTETAKLDGSSTALIVRFGLRATSLSESIVMCSEPGTGKEIGKTVRALTEEFLFQSNKNGALEMLCARYARNVLNARWLWRNRSYAKEVQVNVYQLSGGKKERELIVSSDALSLPVNHFNEFTADEEKLAQYLADGFKSNDGIALEIEALVDFGVRGAVEVYPSQNYNPEKQRGFARSLYKLRLIEETPDLGSGFVVRGHAAIRDQKVGNAIRTVDTWYPSFKEIGLVTPVEPMGANLDIGEFLRTRKESAFELLKSIGNIDPVSEDGQFLLAILIRGGVYGEKSEDKKKANVTSEIVE